jgi:hypothetical protein
MLVSRTYQDDDEQRLFTRKSHWKQIAGTLCIFMTVGLAAVCQACGTSAAEIVPDDTGGATSVSAPVPAAGTDESSPTTVATLVSQASDHVFVELARLVAPMPVYGWDELPAGLTVAAEWWPVVDLDSPDEYEGTAYANPRVSASGQAEPEAQLVLDYGDGWLVVLENVRGDLGDVTGAEVGTVNGNAAALYEFNSGSLVQWSDHGRWYGVFARGVPLDEVVEMALEVLPIED